MQQRANEIGVVRLPLHTPCAHKVLDRAQVCQTASMRNRRCPCCSYTLTSWTDGEYCQVCRRTFVKRSLLYRKCLGWVSIPERLLGCIASKIDPTEELRQVFVSEWHWPFFRYVKLRDVDGYWDARRARGESVEGPMNLIRQKGAIALRKAIGCVGGIIGEISVRDTLFGMGQGVACLVGVALWLALMTLLCVTSLLLTGRMPWRVRRHFT